MMKQAQTQKRIIVFDLMRTLAILIILFHHLPNYSLNFYNLNNFGIPLNLSEINELNRYFGLGIFVFISGYFVKTKTDLTSVDKLKSFVYKKILRIFPLYYLSLICFVYMYSIYSVPNIIIHLLGLQIVFASEKYPPSPTLWFIGLIVIYYFISTIYAIRFSLKKSWKKQLIDIFLIGFPFGIYFIHKSWAISDIRIVTYYLIFWFGIYCARTNFFQKNLDFFRWIAFPIVISVYFLMISVFEIKSIESLSYQSKFIVVNVLMICLILFIYNLFDYMLKKINQTFFLETIAYASYCIFLFHRPILYLLSIIEEKIFLIQNYKILLMIDLLVGIPVIMIFSVIVQRYYDKALRRIL